MNKKPDEQNAKQRVRRLRVMLIFVLAAILFMLMASGSFRTGINSVLGAVLVAVGVFLIALSIIFFVFASKGKKLDDLDAINSQFSKVMRQLNAVRRRVPRINDTIYNAATAAEGLAEVRGYYLEVAPEALDQLQAALPEFYQEYNDYIDNALLLLNEAPVDGDATRATLRDLRERNDTFYEYAMKVRVDYLDKYKK